MRKNNMLRLASVLLVAVLLTTCAVSGVFAKYQTTEDTLDEARVAKWGVTIVDDGADMFGSAYGAGDAIVTDKVTYADSITVDSGDKVVAPGTKGALAALTIKGTPEVDVEVTYTAELTLTGWTIPAPTEQDQDATAEYCPIVITVNETPYYIGGDYTTDQGAVTIRTIADLETAVEKAIVNSKKVYQANTNLETAEVNKDVVVTWAWAYNADTVKDTALGDKAAADNAATIKLVTTTTITQVD